MEPPWATTSRKRPPNQNPHWFSPPSVKLLCELSRKRPPKPMTSRVVAEGRHSGNAGAPFPRLHDKTNDLCCIRAADYKKKEEEMFNYKLKNSRRFKIVTEILRVFLGWPVYFTFLFLLSFSSLNYPVSIQWLTVTVLVSISTLVNNLGSCCTLMLTDSAFSVLECMCKYRHPQISSRPANRHRFRSSSERAPLSQFQVQNKHRSSSEKQVLVPYSGTNLEQAPLSELNKIV